MADCENSYEAWNKIRWTRIFRRRENHNVYGTYSKYFHYVLYLWLKLEHIKNFSYEIYYDFYL